MNLEGFCSGMGEGRSLAIDSQECVNFYPEIHGQAMYGQMVGSATGKAKAPIVLIGTPGMKLFIDAGSIAVPKKYPALYAYWDAASSLVKISGYDPDLTDMFCNGWQINCYTKPIPPAAPRCSFDGGYDGTWPPSSTHHVTARPSLYEGHSVSFCPVWHNTWLWQIDAYYSGTLYTTKGQFDI